MEDDDEDDTNGSCASSAESQYECHSGDELPSKRRCVRGPGSSLGASHVGCWVGFQSGHTSCKPHYVSANTRKALRDRWQASRPSDSQTPHTPHTPNPVPRSLAHGNAMEPTALDAYRNFICRSSPDANPPLVATPVVGRSHPDAPSVVAIPDALVGEDGLVEIKCPLADGLNEFAFPLSIPVAWALQVYTQLQCFAERKWCDLCVVFSSDDVSPTLTGPPGTCVLTVTRFYRDAPEYHNPFYASSQMPKTLWDVMLPELREYDADAPAAQAVDVNAHIAQTLFEWRRACEMRPFAVDAQRCVWAPAAMQLDLLCPNSIDPEDRMSKLSDSHLRLQRIDYFHAPDAVNRTPAVDALHAQCYAYTLYRPHFVDATRTDYWVPSSDDDTAYAQRPRGGVISPVAKRAALMSSVASALFAPKVDWIDDVPGGSLYYRYWHGGTHLLPLGEREAAFAVEKHANNAVSTYHRKMASKRLHRSSRTQSDEKSQHKSSNDSSQLDGGAAGSETDSARMPVSK